MASYIEREMVEVNLEVTNSFPTKGFGRNG